jgi:mediator of RNA polymerase II transcription subunit 12
MVSDTNYSLWIMVTNSMNTELPLDTRQNTVSDIYQHCIPHDESLLPYFMPSSFKELIQTFFRHSINTQTMVNPIDDVPPAQLRPWEWLDYLGDQPLDPKEQMKEFEERRRNRTKQIIRNNASLSLELFDAQVTGESVRNANGQDGDPRTWMFEDSLAAESIYERSWRSGHVSSSVVWDRHVQIGESSSDARGKRSISRGGTPFRASPALSNRSSHGGGVQSANSNRPSPFGKDPMDIDNLYPPMAGNKRKASSAGIGDDGDTSQASGISQGSGIKGKGKARPR